MEDDVFQPKLGEVTRDMVLAAMTAMTAEEKRRYSGRYWEVFHPDFPGVSFPPKRLLYLAMVIGGVGNKAHHGGPPTHRHLEHVGFAVTLKRSVLLSDRLLTELALGHQATKPKKYISETAQFERSDELKAWVLHYSGGKCALCENDAPFQVRGRPYLECHHVVWMRNGGSDTIDNMVAVCPNCHRRVHALEDGNDLKVLQQSMKQRFARLPDVVKKMILDDRTTGA